MPKKSKPKQRINWKARALHCEEVIGVLNKVAKVRAANYNCVIQDRDEYMDRAEAAELDRDLARNDIAQWKERATAAEKHNALLLEKCQIPGTCVQWADLPIDGQRKMLFALLEKTEPAPTHWQRFKSWLGVWKVAVLAILFMLSGVAAFMEFLMRKQGG